MKTNSAEEYSGDEQAKTVIEITTNPTNDQMKADLVIRGSASVIKALIKNATRLYPI